MSGEARLNSIKKQKKQGKYLFGSDKHFNEILTVNHSD